MREPSAAADALSEAVRLNPRHVLARLNLANALSGLNRHAEAVAQCRAALGVDSNDFRVHYTLGNMLSQQSLPDEAVEAYREAVRINPRFTSAHHNMGRSLLRTGRLDEAVEQFRRVLSLEPRDVEAKRMLEAIESQRGG